MDSNRVVTEAEGLKLHLSSKNGTGYRNVYHHKGKFMAQVLKFGSFPFAGHYDTAVERLLIEPLQLLCPGLDGELEAARLLGHRGRRRIRA